MPWREGKGEGGGGVIFAEYHSRICEISFPGVRIYFLVSSPRPSFRYRYERVNWSRRQKKRPLFHQNMSSFRDGSEIDGTRARARARDREKVVVAVYFLSFFPPLSRSALLSIVSFQRFLNTATCTDDKDKMEKKKMQEYRHDEANFREFVNGFDLALLSASSELRELSELNETFISIRRRGRDVQAIHSENWQTSVAALPRENSRQQATNEVPPPFDRIFSSLLTVRLVIGCVTTKRTCHNDQN